MSKIWLSDNWNILNYFSSYTSNSPQFPVPPESDHCSMLRKVRSFPYEMPLSFSPPLALLITEVITQSIIILLQNIQIYTSAPVSTNCSVWLVLCNIMTYMCFSVQLLCKTPTRRLRTLERFKRQTFFYGTTFDLALLQRQPVEVTVSAWMLSVCVVQTRVR